MFFKEKVGLFGETLKTAMFLFWKSGVFVIIVVALVVNLLEWLWLWKMVKGSQEVLITHYNVFFGVDSVVNVGESGFFWKIFFVPLGGLIFIVLGAIISVALFLMLNYSILQSDSFSYVPKKNAKLVDKLSIAYFGANFLLLATLLVQVILLVYLLSLKIVN